MPKSKVTRPREDFVIPQRPEELAPFGNVKTEPTTRERLAATIEKREEARAKIDAQANQREAHRKLVAKATKGVKPGTSDFFRAVAKAERKERISA